MIRANLFPKAPRVNVARAYPIANILLALVLVGQLLLLGYRLFQKARTDEGALRLKTKRETLEAKRADCFGRAADVVAIEGALRGRNEWILHRAASPYLLLAKFEAAKPEEGIFLSFQGTKNTGTIRILTPDLETAQTWVKTALGRLSGTLSVEGESQEGVRVFYSWSE